jgi:hypothetical protein
MAAHRITHSNSAGPSGDGDHHNDVASSCLNPTQLQISSENLPNSCITSALQHRLRIQRLDKFQGEGGTIYASAEKLISVKVWEPTTTYLSPGETGSFFSTSFPPFAKMKCPRFVFPDASFAPSAAMRTRSGSDNSGYGNSFCMWEIRIFCAVYHVVPCLKLPFLLSLRLIVTETVYSEVVFREVWIDIAKPACLGSTTGCTTS